MLKFNYRYRDRFAIRSDSRGESAIKRDKFDENSRDSVFIINRPRSPLACYCLIKVASDKSSRGLRDTGIRLHCFCPSSLRMMLRPSSRFQVTVGFGEPVARHRNLMLPPSWVTIPSADSSSIMSGGITTCMYPIWNKETRIPRELPPCDCSSRLASRITHPVIESSPSLIF